MIFSVKNGIVRKIKIKSTNILRIVIYKVQPYTELQPENLCLILSFKDDPLHTKKLDTKFSDKKIYLQIIEIYLKTSITHCT